jgi:HSP20 family protein
MRFDPFRQLDRLVEQAWQPPPATRSMPMEAFRRGDEFYVAVDLPGVEPDDIELTVERNVVNVRARRHPIRREDDELLVDERPTGEFTRQFFLGDNLDASGLSASLERGVLSLVIPVAEESKPRKVQIDGQQSRRQSIEAGEAHPHTAHE